MTATCINFSVYLATGQSEECCPSYEANFVEDIDNKIRMETSFNKTFIECLLGANYKYIQGSAHLQITYSLGEQNPSRAPTCVGL